MRMFFREPRHSPPVVDHEDEPDSSGDDHGSFDEYQASLGDDHNFRPSEATADVVLPPFRLCMIAIMVGDSSDAEVVVVN